MDGLERLEQRIKFDLEISKECYNESMFEKDKRIVLLSVLNDIKKIKEELEYENNN